MAVTDKISLSPRVFDVASTWLFCPRSDVLEISGFSNQYWADLFGTDLLRHLTPTVSLADARIGLIEIEVQEIKKNWVVKVTKRGALH